MRKPPIIISGILLLAFASFAQDQNAISWQNDLDYLVKRIEIMHPQPYASIPKEEFYKLKDRLFNEIPGLSDTEIVISISGLLAALKDGHTRMGFEFSQPEWLEQNLKLLPLILYPFDDGVFVMAGLPKYAKLVGLQVEKIGKLTTAEAIPKLGALYSHDNRQGQRKSLYYTLAMAEMLKKIAAADSADKINLTLRNAKNKTIHAEIETVPFLQMARFLGSWYPQASPELAAMNGNAKNPLPLWLKNGTSKYWFEYIPEEKTMYLQINSLMSPHGDGEGTFARFCQGFFDAFDQNQPSRLVIDVRANNGGNHVEMPLLKGILARPGIDRHDKLFLITGRVTYSAAVHFTSVFKKYTNATIIGEPTAGRPNHYGAIRQFTLPNHPQIAIGCSVDYYQDSEPFDFNSAIFPAIMTRITSTDYRDNVDPAMKKVRDYDRIVAWVRSLAEELAKAYDANGIDGMKISYYLKKQELLASGYNPEKFLDEFNNNWFYDHKKSAADYTEFLALAVNECPESIDFCYALAANFEGQKRVAEAVGYYNQCLKLNPACHYAKMKLGLLELK